MTRSKKMVVAMVAALMALGALMVVPGETEALTPDWMENTTMPQGMTAFAYCELNDGRVFVANGFNSTDYGMVESTYIYDPGTRAWTEMAPSPSSAYGSTAVAMPDGKVYLFGGYDIDGDVHLTNALIYDVAEDSWSIGMDTMGSKLWNPASAAMDDTHILIAGGQDNDANAVRDASYIYDTELDTFTPTGSLPSARSAGAIVENGGVFYYLGGYDASFVVSDLVFAYYPSSGYWNYYADLPTALLGHRAVMGSDGVVYFVGGSQSAFWSGVNTDKCYLFSLSDYSMEELPALDVSVRYAGLVELNSGELFMFGGHGPTGDNEKGYTLHIWSKEAWVDRSEVGAGNSLRVYVKVEIFFHGPTELYCAAYLEKDDTVYLSQEFYATDDMIASVMITVPEDLEEGSYRLMLPWVTAGTALGSGSFEFEPFDLTVTAAPTLDDRLDDLDAQNQALRDQLNETQAALDDLGAEKMDAMFGYVILVLVLITLVVAVISLVRKK